LNLKVSRSQATKQADIHRKKAEEVQNAASSQQSALEGYMNLKQTDWCSVMSETVKKDGFVKEVTVLLPSESSSS
jgi:hypothetical protein